MSSTHSNTMRAASRRTTLDVMRAARPALAAAIVLLAGCGGGGTTSPVTAGATSTLRYTQAAGVFYRDYTGPTRPAIDAIAADGAFVTATQTFVLDAQMAGPVQTGAPNFYVWGFNRGAAANAPFPDEPNVNFNAVAVVTANGTTLTATVNLLNGSPAVPVTAVLIAPDTIELTIPASALPSTGLAPAAYLWNVWPRSGVGGSATAQIASFLPENAMGNFLTR